MSCKWTRGVAGAADGGCPGGTRKTRVGRDARSCPRDNAQRDHVSKGATPQPRRQECFPGPRIVPYHLHTLHTIMTSTHASQINILHAVQISGRTSPTSCHNRNPKIKTTNRMGPTPEPQEINNEAKGTYYHRQQRNQACRRPQVWAKYVEGCKERGTRNRRP